jgi:hypothetical protein
MPVIFSTYSLPVLVTNMTIPDSLFDLLSECVVNFVPTVQNVKVVIDIKTINDILNVVDLLGSDTAPSLTSATQPRAVHCEASYQCFHIHVE